MKSKIFKYILIAVLLWGLFGCNALLEQTAKDESIQEVSLSDIPEPARIAIERLTAEGQIIKLEKEEVDGRIVYDVEAKMEDKEVEYDVAADGTILTSEQTVSYETLPETVQTAVKKYFGSGEVLKTSKEIEEGKTFYEVEGRKNGSTVELKLSEMGKIVEEE